MRAGQNPGLTPHQRAWFGALRFKISHYDIFAKLDHDMSITGGKEAGNSIKVMISAARVRNEALKKLATDVEQKHIHAGTFAEQQLNEMSADADALLAELGQVTNGGPALDGNS